MLAEFEEIFAILCKQFSMLKKLQNLKLKN